MTAKADLPLSCALARSRLRFARRFARAHALAHARSLWRIKKKLPALVVTRRNAHKSVGISGAFFACERTRYDAYARVRARVSVFDARRKYKPTRARLRAVQNRLYRKKNIRLVRVRVRERRKVKGRQGRAPSYKTRLRTRSSARSFFMSTKLFSNTIDR